MLISSFVAFAQCTTVSLFDSMVYDVKSDVNCLFKAFRSYLLTGSEDAIHVTLRTSVAAQIESTGVLFDGVFR